MLISTTVYWPYYHTLDKQIPFVLSKPVFLSDYFYYIYAHPLPRMGPYIIGGLLGVNYFQFQMRKDNWMNIYEGIYDHKLAWVFSVVLGLATIFVAHLPYMAIEMGKCFFKDSCFEIEQRALYFGLYRYVGSFGILLIFLPQLFERESLMNIFGWWRMISTLSKCLYCLYIYHSVFFFGIWL